MYQPITVKPPFEFITSMTLFIIKETAIASPNASIVVVEVVEDEPVIDAKGEVLEAEIVEAELVEDDED